MRTEPGSPTKSEGGELSWLLGVFRRHKALMIKPLLTTLLLAVVYVALAQRTYTSHALLLVDPTHHNLLAEDALTTTTTAENSVVESEVEILRSPAVALAVIERKGVDKDPEYARKDGIVQTVMEIAGLAEPETETRDEMLGRVLDKFKSKTSIRRRGLTHVIAIEVQSSDPNRAAELTNAMAEVHIERQLQAKVASTLKARDVIKSQMDIAQAAIEGDIKPRERLVVQEEYEDLFLRLREIETLASLQVPDSRIVSPALPPTEPSAPSTKLTVLMALVAGLGIGIGRVLLAETLNTGIMTQTQLSTLAGVSTAAGVPDVGHWLRRPRSMADKLATEPLSRYSDSIRRVRALVDQGLRAQPKKKGQGRLVLVTSSVPNEGKTTLALSLGRVYAQSGQRTLLIDADFRRPSIHRAVGIRPKLDLVKILGQKDEQDLPLAEDPRSDLALLMGSRNAKQATDHLIDAPMFRAILSLALRNFDIVILDTPPLLPASDAQFVTHLADAVVMAVHHGETRQSVVEASLAVLRDEMSPNTTLVPVLNRQPEVHPEYDYNSYHPTYRGWWPFRKSNLKSGAV
ncbi:MAG: polysaccharide biosynthesis tyrosine autokinase [Paracoccaceae bacterium]